MCLSPLSAGSLLAIALVPADIRASWKDSDVVYKTSRNFFYDLHKKREKLIEKKENDKSLVTRLTS